MKNRANLFIACCLPLLGCVPRIEVAAPKEPITINMNVKVEHDIAIKMDEDVKKLLKERSDLLQQNSGLK